MIETLEFGSDRSVSISIYPKLPILNSQFTIYSNSLSRSPPYTSIASSFEGAAPGKHLVLNGHIDCFPVGEHETWTHGGPWSGAVVDERYDEDGNCLLDIDMTRKDFMRLCSRTGLAPDRLVEDDSRGARRASR